ncbi:hypothetical protein [Gibbsiella quercinecans]
MAGVEQQRQAQGMPEPQGKPIQVMESVDNARLLALIASQLARA